MKNVKVQLTDAADDIFSQLLPVFFFNVSFDFWLVCGTTIG